MSDVIRLSPLTIELPLDILWVEIPEVYEIQHFPKMPILVTSCMARNRPREVPGGEVGEYEN